ncbi:MAG TPA: alpha-glucan family phosphorylase [Pyrinomonadaceae bacterium]|nr:alpha-glucan family phosphorylase [Pyrinomonadaceae bacterium]
MDTAEKTSISETIFSQHQKRKLPPQLEKLYFIAANYYWSWQPDGVSLFRDIEPSLWEKCEQNPLELLQEVSELRLWQCAADDDYLKRLQSFCNKFENYLNTPLSTFGKINQENPVAYFCAEFGIHNSLPVYSGGLGILAGDHLKSASDLGLPLVAVGLFYRWGYFRQSITHDGWQTEDYSDLFHSSLPLELVNDQKGQPAEVMIRIRGREVWARAWQVKVGRIPLYLLDTSVEKNNEIDRLITGHLYGGNSETRIVQEKLLGIGGVRLLKKLCIEPSIFHLNEGHSAFLTLELAHNYLEKNPDMSFAEACLAVREKCVFTTHTPVSAGNDVFSPKEIADCFDAKYIESLKLSQQEFFSLGKIDPQNEAEGFGMTPLALRMSKKANGVSRKHGEVSRSLWASLFKTDPENVPIGYVTNGVHPATWISAPLQRLYSKTIGENWYDSLENDSLWAKALNQVSDKDLWQLHIVLKNLLIAMVRKRTLSDSTGNLDTINEHKDTSRLLSPDFLTIGFARRVAQYKRWDLILTDTERLLRLVNDTERPIQFIFAGKAHPQDKTAKENLQKLLSLNHQSRWQARAVFIEDYDQEIARYLVQGVDVWMNVPRRPLEASGTSGMKAAMNGVLNFSILDGWWLEAYNGNNGFAIGCEDINSDQEDDLRDSAALYDTLENVIIPKYYTRDQSGLPLDWIKMMKEAILTVTPRFSSDRMLKQYISEIYNDR